MRKEELSKFFPFGETQRVGNFKMWRARTRIKTTESPMDIEVINVSTLSGEWSVRIPDTYEMYGQVVDLYRDYRTGDEKESKNASVCLVKVFSNMMYASVVGNGFFHKGIEMLATVYANPSLLREDGSMHTEFVSDVKATVEAFLQWRKGYDEEVARQEPTEDDDHHDDLADQASDMLAN